MAKMDTKWVLLCTTAIGAIYAAGYYSTETQGNLQAPSTVNQNHVESTSDIQIKSKYKNGTFYGTGSNRRGEIQVAVTLKNDKIIDVEISNFGMHYSERDVVDLPQEVVHLQSAQVTNVSGATYSTQAFKDAVQNALAQALNS
ncbi:FMN-binding protein [Paenibacillus oryzisoli]|uniref:FMN-binding protein n=1 Tax=Paenibacillus oryzisoli TaxID=1850517 RepID=UPI003D2A0082